VVVPVVVVPVGVALSGVTFSEVSAPAAGSRAAGWAPLGRRPLLTTRANGSPWSLWSRGSRGFGPALRCRRVGARYPVVRGRGDDRGLRGWRRTLRAHAWT